MKTIKTRNKTRKKDQNDDKENEDKEKRTTIKAKAIEPRNMKRKNKRHRYFPLSISSFESEDEKR